MPSETISNSLVEPLAESSASEESSAQPTPNLSTQPLPENTVKKPPTSDRRIQANRRNALLSTGPKSARGKAMSAQNSGKHGLLAKSSVIMGGPAKENKAEFNKLLSGLRDYFNPTGTAEDLLVEQIAVSYWMERRAQLYETCQIRKQVRSAASDYSEYHDTEDREEKFEYVGAELMLESHRMELVLRYTTAHEKRRSRALAQLERLQRQRGGETIPAPIDVQVTGDTDDFTKRSQ